MVLNGEVNDTLLGSLVQRDRQERFAVAASTSDVVSRLGGSGLPLQCQQLVRAACVHGTGDSAPRDPLAALDPLAASLWHAGARAGEMDDEYEMLKLRQKNKELQLKIDRNTKCLDNLRQELSQLRASLAAQTPNPDTIQDCSRQLRLKLANYAESQEKAKMKFSKLSVPEEVLPKSLSSLAGSLAELSQGAESLRRAAEEVHLVRQARQALIRLKK